MAITRTRRGEGPFDRLEAPEGTAWIVGLIVVLMMMMAVPSRAAESPSRLDLPEPWAFVSPDSISFAVIHARPDDEGFRGLLDTAWEGLKNSKSSAIKGPLGYVLKVVQGDKSNGLMTFLPLQMVRVDSLDPESGLPHPTVAVTVAGWPGLQQAFYTYMSGNGKGGAYPTKELGDATLILREGWEDPTRSHVLTKVNGTIVSFPTVKKAESTVKLLMADKPARPAGELSTLAASLDATRDTYGVLINRRDSLLKFLTWLNKSDMTRARKAVGEERMDKVISKVSSMTWEGDLVSDDEMKFVLRFRTDSPESRKELTSLLKDVRGVLDSYGRAGEMESTGIGSELLVDFTMVGYREMLKSYIAASL